MALLRSRRTRAADELEAAGDLAGAIEELSRVNRTHRDPAHERRLIDLRHRAGEVLIGGAGATAEYLSPAGGALPDGDGLAEVDAADLSAPLLREAVLTKGSLLVRGLVPRDEALRLADGIDEAFAAREGGDGADDGLYEEFTTPEHPGFVERGFTAETGRHVDRRLAQARLRRLRPVRARRTAHRAHGVPRRAGRRSRLRRARCARSSGRGWAGTRTGASWARCGR